MSKHWIVAAVCLSLAVPALAGDGKEKKVEAKPIKREEVKAGDRSGGFKGFWIHTVGGTIGNGLKSGARKIEKTFD